MKHFFRIVFLLLLLTPALFSCTGRNSTATNDSLVVLSWNVWHAGHSESYPGNGCDGTIGILKKSNADIITMVETYGNSDNVADSLGYYHRLLSSNLSIYSRYPIIETYTFPDSIDPFNFGGVMIDKGGQKIRVFATWLHYLPDICTLHPDTMSAEEIVVWDESGTRDDEIRKILSVLTPFMAQTDSIPIIMGGDFNIHSHMDWTEATKTLYGHAGKVVPWTVSTLMEKAGFKDSFREIHPDPAENLGVTWRYAFGPNGFEGYHNSSRNDRIDYIYYQGATIQATDCESHNGLIGELYRFRGEDFFYGSDHGFVLTTFALK